MLFEKQCHNGGPGFNKHSRIPGESGFESSGGQSAGGSQWQQEVYLEGWRNAAGEDNEELKRGY